VRHPSQSRSGRASRGRRPGLAASDFSSRDWSATVSATVPRSCGRWRRNL